MVSHLRAITTRLPVALYPDDLLLLVLTASTSLLEIAKAQRFLANSAKDKNLKTDPSISQPVLNLHSYPDVTQLMGNDPDWTEELDRRDQPTSRRSYGCANVSA